MIVNEGGSMPGVGPIHISEIEPTLKALEKVLGIDIHDNVLGSVGKKEFSGDIDVALQIDTDKIPEFVERLKKTPLILDIKRSSVIMTKVQIVDYDPEKQTSKERTGYVQVDFMPGDPEWMKTFYHAPHEKDSKYKCVFRNLLISSIVPHYQAKVSDETIDDGRPVKQERWMWSSNDGLVRVIRKPKPRKDGKGYTKGWEDTRISEPMKDPKEIVKTLGLDSPDDLYSFETLLAAIEKNYPPDLVKKVKQSFADNRTAQDIGLPDEVKTTESLADKQLRRIKELTGL